MDNSQKSISSQQKFCKIMGLNSTGSSTTGNQTMSSAVSVIRHAGSFKQTLPKFQCPQCPEQLSTGSNLKIHVLQTHKMVSTLRPAETLICRVCNMILKSKAQLDAHIDAHYINYESNAPSYYFCTTCKLSFKRKSDISYHNEHVCKHVVEAKPSSSSPEIYAVSLKRKFQIVNGRLIDKPQSVPSNTVDKNLEDDIEMVEEIVAVEENPGSRAQTNIEKHASNRRKRRYVHTYQEMLKMKNSNPVLLKNPKSTLLNYKHSFLDDEIANLQIDEDTPEEVRVLSIATEQVIDRAIKCFRCNLYFKTHKDLKAHLDEWHIAELTELNHHFTKPQKMVVKHKCTGCTLSFPTVRQLTKHYYKDCRGNPKKSRLEVEENSTSEEVETCAGVGGHVQEDNDNTSKEVHTSDAELLTYLQQAANNSEKPRLEMHAANIASIQVNDRSVKCIRCNLEFPGHLELKAHLDEFHQQELTALSSKYIKEDLEIQHKCSRCSLKFTTVRLLSKHYRECTEPEYPTKMIHKPKQTNNVNTKNKRARTSPRKLKKL